MDSDGVSGADGGPGADGVSGADGEPGADGGPGPTEWTAGEPVGVGPWPGGPDEWPSDPRYDPELLRDGD
ncbi:MAG: hypothetical protein QOI75_3351, partial [Pseudonocardiales bacterium]|nr:hypothetical protein [Pseudonocardiales bacterium]